jgi:hypothetical protein
MGIPLLRGRAFDESDRRDSKLVMLVNQRFVERFFGGSDPIGKRLTPGMSVDPGDPPMREIVGLSAT